MKTKTAVFLVILLVVVLGLGFFLTREKKDSSPISDTTILPTDWTKGSATSSVVLIEYSDFQCPACRAYYPIVNRLMIERPDIAFVYRHFPLVTIHANADIAAEAAEAAGRQGKFWEMHDLIFEKQDEWSRSTQARTVFAGYATTLGIDVEQFNKDILDNKVRSKVTDDYRLGLKAKVQGTPTFFLNGVRMTGVNSYEEFLGAVDLVRNNIVSSPATLSALQ